MTKYDIIISDKIEGKFGILLKDGEFEGVLLSVSNINHDSISMKLETDIVINPKEVDIKSIEFEETINDIVLDIIKNIDEDN